VGQGVLASLVGVLVFLLLLLLAVQVVFHLYATSVVTAATFDGARLAAASGGLGQDEAATHVRGLLGRYGEDRVEVSFAPDPDDVVLTVVAESPSVLPATLRRPMRMDRIERTVRVRIERAG
jgi:hypothetical protein